MFFLYKTYLGVAFFFIAEPNWIDAHYTSLLIQPTTLWQFRIYVQTIKVIIEKSRGEVSLVEQDTIENVSYSQVGAK